MRVFAETLLSGIAGSTTQWLLPPDATTLRGIAAWTQDLPSLPVGAARYVCLANYDLERNSGYFGVPALPRDATLKPVFTTLGAEHLDTSAVISNGFFHRIENLEPGEGRVYLFE